MSILSIKNLYIKLNLRDKACYAVNGASFSLDKGEVLGIVGESGAGKSITSYSILGLLPEGISELKADEFILLDRDVLKFKEKDYRRIRGRDVSIIFQDPMTSLNPYMRVGKQIIEPLRLHCDVSSKEARLEALKTLEEVGISDSARCYNRYPYEFSGGMQQRIMIAMAIITKPKLLIADEPTTALDVTVQAQILRLLQKLVEEHEMGMIFISHDLGVISEIADRVAVMYAGQIMESGYTNKIFNAPVNPYTLMLKESIPSIYDDKEVLSVIPGNPPDITEKFNGCPFAERCFKSDKKCFECGKVELSEISSNHYSACIKKS